MTRFALLFAAVASVLAAACAVEPLGEETGETTSEITAPTTKKQIQYIVTAHPDDELASWSLIEKSAANYPVFIVLTKGEETAYCEPGGETHLQVARGEAAPKPAPWAGRFSRACEDARISSWHRFLDAMADGDRTLSKPPFRGTFSAPGNAGPTPPGHMDGDTLIEARSFRVWSDGSSARVSFDLGDGDLSPEEVTWAIQAVRSRRAELFPLTKEYGVVAASYSNLRNDIGCELYDHRDHRAVHTAIWSTDQGTPGPQWGRTCINDPDVAGTGGRVESVDADTWTRAMGVDAPSIDPVRYPNATRTGAYQIHYGWLRPAFWEGGTAGVTQMDRRQAFWKRF